MTYHLLRYTPRLQCTFRSTRTPTLPAHRLSLHTFLPAMTTPCLFAIPKPLYNLPLFMLHSHRVLNYTIIISSLPIPAALFPYLLLSSALLNLIAHIGAYARAHVRALRAYLSYLSPLRTQPAHCTRLAAVHATARHTAFLVVLFLRLTTHAAPLLPTTQRSYRPCHHLPTI